MFDVENIVVSYFAILFEFCESFNKVVRSICLPILFISAVFLKISQEMETLVEIFFWNNKQTKNKKLIVA